MSRKKVPEFEEPQSKKGTLWRDTRGLPKAEKKASAEAATPIAIDKLLFRFSGAIVDHEYTDGWNWDLSPKESKDLLDLLADVSQKTWADVKEMKTNSKNNSRPLHHDQPVDSIDKRAQKRLEEIGRGDQEKVFRLRHGNMVRVWGVLDGSLFHILWYDRDHKVCPVDN